jgi:hypothetical protein
MLRGLVKREREREIEKEKKERGLKFLGWENRRHFMVVRFLSLCGEEIRPRGLGGMNDKKLRSVPRTMIFQKWGPF